MVLRMKLEDAPYSLTQEELTALRDNDLLNNKLKRFFGLSDKTNLTPR